MCIFMYESKKVLKLFNFYLQFSINPELISISGEQSDSDILEIKDLPNVPTGMSLSSVYNLKADENTESTVYKIFDDN